MQWPKYQGIEVLVQQKILGRHPKYGYEKLCEIKNSSLLLLADGTELVVCDDCGFNGLTGREPYVKPDGEPKKIIIKQADSIIAHRNGTHNRKNHNDSLYTDEQIAFFIKAFLKWQARGVKSWRQKAVDDLNNMGFKTCRGHNWTVSALAHLVREHVGKPRFKDIRTDVLADIAKEDLAKMVHAAQVRETARSGKKSTVATTARITEVKIPHQSAVTEEQPEEATAESVVVPRQEVKKTEVTEGPTLSFPRVATEKPEVVLPVSEKIVTKGNFTIAPAATAKVEPQFELVTTLDGKILFKYCGVLMVASPVKGFEI